MIVQYQQDLVNDDDIFAVLKLLEGTPIPNFEGAIIPNSFLIFLYRLLQIHPDDRFFDHDMLQFYIL